MLCLGEARLALSVCDRRCSGLGASPCVGDMDAGLWHGEGPAWSGLEVLAALGHSRNRSCRASMPTSMVCAKPSMTSEAWPMMEVAGAASSQLLA